MQPWLRVFVGGRVGHMLVLGAAVTTKPPPPVIFCEVGANHSRRRQSYSHQLESVVFEVAAATLENCSD